MSANRETVVSTGRTKLAQGKERSGDRQPTGCREAMNEGKAKGVGKAKAVKSRVD